MHQHFKIRSALFTQVNCKTPHILERFKSVVISNDSATTVSGRF